MARQRDEIPTDAPEPITGTPQPNRRKQPRVIVYLKPDGTPDYEALSDEQRAKLQPPGTSAGPGVPTTEPPPEPIPPESIMMIMTLLTSIESSIIASKLELPPEQVNAALQPPKPIADGIVAAGTKVANKYGGTLGRWADEIALCSLLVVWQSQAFAQIRALKAAKDSTEPQPATKPTVSE